MSNLDSLYSQLEECLLPCKHWVTDFMFDSATACMFLVLEKLFGNLNENFIPSYSSFSIINFSDSLHLYKMFNMVLGYINTMQVLS